MTLAKDPSEQAKRFIDASLGGGSRPPSKAAYARAIKLARQAIEELASLAGRMEKSPATAAGNLRSDLRRRSR
jgi:hypothetical protein